MSRIPTEGVLVTGLYLTGAKYCLDKCAIIEADNMALNSKMPVLHLLPARIEYAKEEYSCPMY